MSNEFSRGLHSRVAQRPPKPRRPEFFWADLQKFELLNRSPRLTMAVTCVLVTTRRCLPRLFPILLGVLSMKSCRPVEVFATPPNYTKSLLDIRSSISHRQLSFQSVLPFETRSLSTSTRLIHNTQDLCQHCTMTLIITRTPEEACAYWEQRKPPISSLIFTLRTLVDNYC